ncbi:hypothetical protein AAG570_011203, partial [Ranatra chinensis]
TIRFFNRTEYYTLHGTDAVFAAKEVFRTTSFIKKIGSGADSLDSLIVNKSQFETFVRDLLLVKHYRVEVYVNKGSKSGSNWALEYKGSPGNLSQFEEILFTNSDQTERTAVIGIKFGGDSKVIGIALVDVGEQCFYATEFPDDEYMTNLEAMVVQYGPKECLISGENSPEAINVKKVVERCGVLVTSRKKSDFSTDGLVQDLNRLLKFKDGQQQNSNTLPQMNLTNAMSALAAVIKYLELSSDSENHSQFELTNLDQGKFVHLDSAAVSALSITPSCPGAGTGSHTVMGLLDRCRTSHGHRLLQQWVRQPLKDINLIAERHDIVQLLAEETLLRQSLYEEHLRKIPDFQMLSKRLQRKKASLQDCYRIYQGVLRIPQLVECLEEYCENGKNSTVTTVLIEPLKEHLGDMEKYREMMVSTLDMSLVDKGEFLVKAEFDEDLQNLREKMDDLEESMKRELNRVARDLGLEPNKSLKLESNSQFGYFFRVTLKEEKSIRNNKEYTQLDATKSGVRFRSTKLSSVNEDYLEVREDYLKHQESVEKEIISIAVGYCDTLHKLSHILAKLDVLCSFAVVSVGAPKPYVRPKMRPSGSGVLKLVQARHPCLELIDSVSYIPNDIEFEQDRCTFCIITGPNMGGKSTYIRSMGVIALLAHIGCLVPCDSAEISVIDAILARVGANDSQIKGMSTFMVEMVETASILKTATSNSLVIIDELGRGTSTYEGCGIAWAIAEYLAKDVKSFCLFATHFHELTRLEEEIPTLRNFHVTAVTSDDSLTLLYQVKPGACDQSFGIHVAHMAKFPDHVIADAKRKLSELEDYQSAIVADSDSKKRKIVKVIP